MLKGQDDAAFGVVLQDLCTAFNRPYTPDVTRVFWESLKHISLGEVKALAAKHRLHGKRFPTPKELSPERPARAPKPIDNGPEMSRYAVAANRMLLKLAYEDERRGFKPLGAELLQRLLAAKRDFVGMAEADERAGELWPEGEFDRTCQHGFEKLLGTAGAAA